MAKRDTKTFSSNELVYKSNNGDFQLTVDGTLKVKNLEVTGENRSVSDVVKDLNVSDRSIVLNHGTTKPTTSGILIDRGIYENDTPKSKYPKPASIVWNESELAWDFNNDLTDLGFNKLSYLDNPYPKITNISSTNDSIEVALNNPKSKNTAATAGWVAEQVLPIKEKLDQSNTSLINHLNKIPKDIHDGDILYWEKDKWVSDSPSVYRDNSPKLSSDLDTNGNVLKNKESFISIDSVLELSSETISINSDTTNIHNKKTILVTDYAYVKTNNTVLETDLKITGNLKAETKNTVIKSEQIDLESECLSVSSPDIKLQSKSTKIESNIDVNGTVTVNGYSLPNEIGNPGESLVSDGTKLVFSKVTGNSSSWANTINITLSGDVNGSVEIDGTSDATMNVMVHDDSHRHTIENIKGLSSALAEKMQASVFSPENILEKIKLVDGYGSGLDSDLLAGKNYKYYLNASNISAGVIDPKRIPNIINSDTTGTASKADSLSYSRNISLVGAVSGTASFDGSQDIEIKTTLLDSDHKHSITDINGLEEKFYTVLHKSDIGTENGVVPLNSSRTIDQKYLPGYVSEVKEYKSYSEFPSTGSLDVLYFDSSELVSYRWTGSKYLKIISSDTSDRSVTSTRWESPVHMTLSGDVSGTCAFDGSKNISLDVRVLDDTHSHDTRYYTKNQTDDRFVKVTGGNLEGPLTGTFNGDLSGNSTTASKLKTPRRIEIAGAVSGNIDFDGSDDVSIETVIDSSPTVTFSGDVSGYVTLHNLQDSSATLKVKDDSHNHSIDNVRGLSKKLESLLSKTADINNGNHISKVGTLSTGITLDYSPKVNVPVVDSEGNVRMIFGSKESSEQIVLRMSNEGTVVFKNKDNLTIGEINSKGILKFNSYEHSSALKYKTDISSIDDVIDKILNIDIIRYKSKDPIDDKTRIGVTAESLASVFPEYVNFVDGEPDSVNYGQMTAILIKAIQELKEPWYKKLFKWINK